jgi:hypothetical protein
MSKKQKRQVSRSDSPAQGGKVEIVMDKTAGASNHGGTVEFNPDYTYVKKDLKVIGTLAVTFFIVLIALSFIIK